MTNEEFRRVIDDQIGLCKEVLNVKRNDYDGVEGDRFNAFKRAAILQNCSMKEALAGMMAKHTTSIYDMCENPKGYPHEMWIEKITDHINYLLLLRAIVEEEMRYDKSCE